VEVYVANLPGVTLQGSGKSRAYQGTLTTPEAPTVDTWATAPTTTAWLVNFRVVTPMMGLAGAASG
jgi:hypothetical protein